MNALPQGLVTAGTAIVATIVNALWEDALLVVCVWLLLRSWKRVNASTRYAIWCATLVAAVIVPVATTLPFFSVSSGTAASQSAVALRPAARTPGEHLKPPLATHLRQTIHVRESRSADSIASKRVVMPVTQLPERLHVTFSPLLAVGLFALWIVLAAIALIRLAIGLYRLEQLKHDALPLPVEYRDAMEKWGIVNKGKRDVRLCVIDEIDVPVAVGLFDAMILIPRALLERLSESEVDQITLHELAHLRRADDWTNGLQRVVAALLPWNPAVQFIGQQLDLEREVACDDWVLSVVGTVRPYALCLTKMAETASWPRSPMPAPGVFATRKHISLRIERLLAAGRNIATGFSPAPAAAAVAVLGALALAMGVVAPSVAAPFAAQPRASTATVAQTAPPATSAAMRAARPSRQPAVAAKASPIAAQPSRIAQAAPSPAASATPHDIHISASTIHLAPHTVHVPARTVTIPEATYTVPGQDIHVPEITATIPTEKIDAATSGLAREIDSSVRAALSGQHGAFGKTVAQTAKTCTGCNLRGVDYSGRDLSNVSYTGVDLSHAKLAGTNFSGGTFNGVDFTGANLRNASFRGARLVGCDFSRADLTGVDFTGAHLSGCQFTRAQLTSTQLRDVLDTCTGCDFSHANLAGVDLSNVRASSDDFSRADLRNANFSGAQLTGIDFSSARLDGANFNGTVVNGCDFSHVDLTHVDFSKAKLIGTDLTNRSGPP